MKFVIEIYFMMVNEKSYAPEEKGLDPQNWEEIRELGHHILERLGNIFRQGIAAPRHTVVQIRIVQNRVDGRDQARSQRSLSFVVTRPPSPPVVMILSWQNEKALMTPMLPAGRPL